MTAQYGQTLHRFHGGVKLRHWKQLSLSDDLPFAGIPPELILPLKQHRGRSAKPVVAVGDRVLRDQLIAVADGPISANLHAPASGHVRAIEPRPIIHPSNLSAPCIVIETDGRDESLPTESRWAQYNDWQSLPADTILQRIQDAGIVGLGGAAFPTDIKLGNEQAQPVELLLINGVECEPYIACDETLMRQRALEFLRGSQIVAQAVGAAQVIVAVEDQMGVTELVLNNCCRENQIDDIQIVKVPTVYPEGNEDQLVKAVTGKEIPSGGHPLQLGVLCLNVGTARAVHEAVVHGRTLTSRVVTLTGRGFEQPCNVMALIGTPVSFLAAVAGGYGEVSRLVAGGPMMGIPLASDDRPITKATNAIVALTSADTSTSTPELPCIRCMECARVCPSQLLPQQLLWHLRTGDFEQVEEHNLADCMECGACAYVCPSQIPLVDYYRYGKAELRQRALERDKAEHARRRFEEREQRLEASKARRKARLDARAPAGDVTKQDAIAAAIARAKAKKADADQSDQESTE